MAERLVRFRDRFFEDLDRQLPPERSPTGIASATDFLLYDLPTIRDTLARDFEGTTTEIRGGGSLRVFVGTGTLVHAAALYCLLAEDDHVDVIGLELDLGDRDTAPDD
jgi:hypothetical protein